MKQLGRKQWFGIVVLALVLLATGLFAVRTVRRAVYWRLRRDEVIRPWMSVPYVAHSYRVPPPVLYKALAIAPQPHDRRPIKEIARERNTPVEQLITTLEDAIARERAAHPPGSYSTPPAGRSP
ncbi:MAG: hypothetical protein ABR607_10735 [Pyrinomonadaceae bacterium]